MAASPPPTSGAPLAIAIGSAPRPGGVEGVADAGQPLGRVHVPRRRHQVAEPPMPEVEEVLGGEAAAGPVVGLDGRQVDVDGASC